jgi:hypothetical protein
MAVVAIKAVIKAVAAIKTVMMVAGTVAPIKTVMMVAGTAATAGMAITTMIMIGITINGVPWTRTGVVDDGIRSAHLAADLRRLPKSMGFED